MDLLFRRLGNYILRNRLWIKKKRGYSKIQESQLKQK
jgi:hypothetical protein